MCWRPAGAVYIAPRQFFVRIVPLTDVQRLETLPLRRCFRLFRLGPSLLLLREGHLQAVPWIWTSEHHQTHRRLQLYLSTHHCLWSCALYLHKDSRLRKSSCTRSHSHSSLVHGRESRSRKLVHVPSSHVSLYLPPLASRCHTLP